MALHALWDFGSLGASASGTTTPLFLSLLFQLTLIVSLVAAWQIIKAKRRAWRPQKPSRPDPARPRLRAISVPERQGIQGTPQAARDRETRKEPSANHMSSNSSQADSSVPYPHPLHLKSAAEQSIRVPFSMLVQRLFGQSTGNQVVFTLHVRRRGCCGPAP